MSNATQPSRKAQGAAPGYKPVQTWAALGVLMFLFQAYVFGSWVLGPNFVPTPATGTIPEWQRLYFIALQTVVPLLALVLIWHFVVRPWRRDGRLSFDGMIFLAGIPTVFWDPCMNYTSTSLLYNAHLVNFGAWTLHSWPGWTSPQGHLLPEPILLTGSGYTALVMTQAFLMLWLLRKAKARWPGMGALGAVACIVVGITIGDSLLEMALIRTGVYAYPGGIREITLFAGETYQFPMSEGFLFGGLAIGSITALMYFRDDKGQTWVEKGLDRMRLGSGGKQWVKFFAIFGYIHTAFFVLYMIPNQWLATHSDPFPQGYPDHMINGMCVAGDQRNECPGPGVSMPRPVNNPF